MRRRTVIIATLALLALAAVAVWAFFTSRTPIDGEVGVGAPSDVWWSMDAATVSKVAGDAGTCAGGLSGADAARTLTIAISGAAPGLHCRYEGSLVNPGPAAALLGLDLDLAGIDTDAVVTRSNGTPLACGDVFAAGGAALNVVIDVQVTEAAEAGQTFAIPEGAGVGWVAAAEFASGDCL